MPSKRSVIMGAPPGGLRGDDGKVNRVTPPCKGGSEKFTQKFEASALTQTWEIRVRYAKQIRCESDYRMWPFLFAQVKAAYEGLSFESMVSMGADEMNRRKRHSCLTVFADLVTKGFLFATPDKDASVWEAYRWGIAAAQWAFHVPLIRGSRH
jgi:hypothetical protein